MLGIAVIHTKKYGKINGKSFDFYHFLMYNINVVKKEKLTFLD